MTVCDKDQCTGCMACVDICLKSAIIIKDNIRSYNAEIDETVCIKCDACHRMCQNNYEVVFNVPQHWFQGWAEDSVLRNGGSSGGVASAIISGFIKSGGYVCSCILKDGIIGFELTNDLNIIPRMSGSKYVKSNPQGIYKKIKALLKSGEKILFIGLPCQVEAVKRFAGDSLQERLYTVDMICHGTPSPKILDMYLSQHGKSLKDLKDIKFRKKGQFGLNDGYASITKSGMQDTYLMAFLNGTSYTENCYSCKFARTERVSDLTLGDAWNSQLDHLDIKKGISLILSQSEKGEYLLKIGNIHLEKVDVKNAVENNAQLKHPSIKPKERDSFLSALQRGKSIDSTVMRLIPTRYFRQFAKIVLIKLHIIKRGGGYI